MSSDKRAGRLERARRDGGQGIAADDDDPHPILMELGLERVRVADKPVFDRAFGALKQPISDYTFAATFMWGSALHLGWRIIENHICVFTDGDGALTMLLPPMALPGATDADLRAAMDACFAIMDGINEPRGAADRSRIEYVSDEIIERVSAARCEVSAAPIWGDYVYETARMIDLAGGPLKSKRKARSKFQRDYPDHRLEILDDASVAACLNLLERWGEHGDITHLGERSDAAVETEALRDRDRIASRAALEHFRGLGLTGMTLWVEDRLIGFTLGEALSPSQAVIHIEKTDPAFDGAPQMIFSSFCERCWHDLPEINVGDDWGIPGLRFTKQSYRPTRMLSKHVLTRTPAVQVAGGNIDDVPARNPRHTISAGGVYVGSEPVATIRLATREDAARIESLERTCFTREEETFKLRQIKGLLTNPNAFVTVAEVDGEVAGWAVGLVRLHRHPRSGQRYKLGRLYAVAVDPNRRGLGVGRQLVVRTLAALEEAGAARIYLEVRDNNTPAIALYESLGFTQLKKLRNYYGENIDGRRMVRILEPPGEAGG